MSEAATGRAGVLERVLHGFHAQSGLLPGDASARAARTRAAARLSELGWPSARDEQWRYTNLRAFERLASFVPASTAVALPAGFELPPAVPGFERLIYVDGRRVEGAHTPSASVSTAAPAADITWPGEQRLGLLADMFSTDAARLHIDGEAAIEVLFVSTGQSPCYPRLELAVAAGGRLRLIERHLGPPAAAASLIACNVTLELARDAMLTHYRLQQCARDRLFTDTLAARVGQGARYAARSIAVGAGSARTSAAVELIGRGAVLSWAAIAAGRGEQVHDVALKVEHAAPDTRTEELFRGIADERARVAFSGHIRIAGEAPASQARQSLRGLIEGTAEIDLRPRLEILTDDVQATHGATTGQLDQDLLFYLLARGLDRSTARALLKWAFLSDVLREIDLPALRAEAERLAAGQLPDVPPLGGLS